MIHITAGDAQYYTIGYQYDPQTDASSYWENFWYFRILGVVLLAAGLGLLIPYRRGPEMNRLGIGCEANPTGDMNIERYRISQMGTATTKSRIDLIADAQYLPFKDKSFPEKYASHVIEHVENPSLALHEWERVAVRRIIVKNSYNMVQQRSLSQWTITRTWLRRHGFHTEITRRNPMVTVPFLPIRLMIDTETTAVREVG